jgi:hypothetical protein
MNTFEAKIKKLIPDISHYTEYRSDHRLTFYCDGASLATLQALALDLGSDKIYVGSAERMGSHPFNGETCLCISVGSISFNS